MTNYRPQRAKYLTVVGLNQALFGWSMTLGLSNAIIRSYSWLPDWLNHDEFGIAWIGVGFIVSFLGMLRLIFPKKIPDSLETIAFSLILFPMSITLMSLIAGIEYAGLLFPSVTSATLQFMLPTILIANWPDPKKRKTIKELLPPAINSERG